LRDQILKFFAFYQHNISYVLIKHHGQQSLLIVGVLATRDNDAIKQRQALKQTQNRRKGK
jgi:hypothetical protein